MLSHTTYCFWMLQVIVPWSIMLWTYILNLKDVITLLGFFPSFSFFISFNEAPLIEFVLLFSADILSYPHSWKTWASILSTVSCRSTWTRGTWAATFTCRTLKRDIKIYGKKMSIVFNLKVSIQINMDSTKVWGGFIGQLVPFHLEVHCYRVSHGNQESPAK